MDQDKNDVLNMLWDEWKYRNQSYWRSFYRFGFMILFVMFIPYVYPEIVKKLGELIIVFPIAGGILSVFTAWLLDAESARFKNVMNKIRELQGENGPEEFLDDTFVEKIRKFRMGTVISVMFGVVLVVLSIASAFVLLKYGV